VSDIDSLSFPGVQAKGPYCRPLVDGKLTDTFGAPRSGGRKHMGIDIFAPEGTPIHAIAGGTVVQGFGNELGGNVVRIQGDDGRYYYYAHLKAHSFDHLKVGEHVNAGQVIGGVGHTGDAADTPNHLHLQVREHGQWVNPFDFLQPLPDLSDLADPATTGPAADPFAIDHGAPPTVADSDHDGLTDQFETIFGTDAHQVDSDHDGLSDAYETSISHTDPLSKDTDHDGVGDAHEIAQGTDAGHAELPEAARAANFAGLGDFDSDHDGLTDAYEAEHPDTNQLDAHQLEADHLSTDPH
jgi:Peptidase family M23/Bacterial TSP3 repeat